jgi:hypothetical protein
MSNPDTSREGSSAVAPSNDTLITINQQPSATANIATASPNPNPPEQQAQNANEEMNSSIGSQRSLNSRLFPFRISRDTIWNNVRTSKLVYCNYVK